MNLYLMPAGYAGQESAGTAEHCARSKTLFDELPKVFNWAIFDTPPLLFSADANLLATLADGTHPGGQDRLHHLRQRHPRHAVAVREQRARHRGQRRARLRTVQQVHVLLLEGGVGADLNARVGRPA